jgi:hypothetical protein
LRYEAVETVDNRDKLTGKVEPVIFFANGKEAILTPDQNAVFRSAWNKACEIDARILACVTALLAYLYPPGQS